MNTKAKVLVVDDDDMVRLSHQRSLQSVRCDVEAARDGDQALCAMEHKQFDVVLLDVRMPGRDGISVLKEMRKRWPESQVVIITGYPNVDGAKEAVRLGAYDYLAKPVGPAEVINATRGAVTQKRWTLQADTTQANAGSIVC